MTCGLPWRSRTSPRSCDRRCARRRLTWMSDHAVPSSDGFEEFFRWAVFGELIFDDDGLALLGSDGVPVSLPAGWVLEPRREARVDAIAVHLERPHVAAVRETTWLTMRADGWSRVRIGPTGPASETVGVPTPPRFVTVRPDADTSRSTAWFRNEEVVGMALIGFVADCRRHQATELREGAQARVDHEESQPSSDSFGSSWSVWRAASSERRRAISVSRSARRAGSASQRPAWCDPDVPSARRGSRRSGRRARRRCDAGRASAGPGRPAASRAG